MGNWAPGMNIYESKTDLIVMLDIPGIDPKALEINLQGQMLTIRGDREQVALR